MTPDLEGEFPDPNLKMGGGGGGSSIAEAEISVSRNLPSRIQSGNGQSSPSTAVNPPVENPAQPSGGASNVANGPKLANQLAKEETASRFSLDGKPSPAAIKDSREIINAERLGNTALKERLTADGSKLGDWGKFETPSFQTPSGSAATHYYYNPTTRTTYLTTDYKTIINNNAKLPPFVKTLELNP